MKISFTIPFYSTPQYLDEAVRSVLKQTETDWELIVVDNCSPHPGIKELAHSYQDDRIHYHRTSENRGYVDNFNRCLELANADFVTILHADDKLQPHYAATLLRAFATYPDATAIFCQADLIDPAGNSVWTIADLYKKLIVPSNRTVYSLEGERGLLSLLHGNFIMCPTVCYQKKLLGSTRFTLELHGVEDWDFFCQILFKGGKLIGLPQKAYSYRRHDNSLTSDYLNNGLRFEQDALFYRRTGAAAARHGWLRAARKSRLMESVILRLGFCTLADLSQLRLKAFYQKLKLAHKLIFQSNT